MADEDRKLRKTGRKGDRKTGDRGKRGQMKKGRQEAKEER